MKRIKLLALLLIVLMIITTLPNKSNSVYANEVQTVSDEETVYVNHYTGEKRDISFDNNWLFKLNEESQGAMLSSFEDSGWERVNLPHDFSINQPYNQNLEAESAYKAGGIGIYRKHFTLSKDNEGKRVYINFDGAYMETEVYVNSQKVGINTYGYNPFTFDITDYVHFDKENIIAVKVINNVPTSRWYSGSGIGRKTTLTLTDSVHIKDNSSYIYAPNLKNEYTTNVGVNVETLIQNQSERDTNVKVRFSLLKDGNLVGEYLTDYAEVSANTDKKFTGAFSIDRPELWDIDSPNLYVFKTDVIVNDAVIDTNETNFGFKYMEFDANNGLKLNGRSIKLNGVSMHHDQGSLGSVDYKTSIERQIRILKDMGVNSIRTTHNTAARELIEAADRNGILIIEEFFDGLSSAKNGNYNDFARYFNKEINDGEQAVNAEVGMKWSDFVVRATMLRDRNSPSVFAWSMGNEITEGITGGKQVFPAIAERIYAIVSSLDKVRPGTIGDNRRGDEKELNDIHEQLSRHTIQGLNGYNYADGARYDMLHKRYPNYLIYGSETASSVNSRGVYNVRGRNNVTYELSSYDDSKVGWGHYAAEALYHYMIRDFVMGTYVWTGFDYLGEPTFWNGTSPGRPVNLGNNSKWPYPKSSYFGIVDTAGIPKDSYYLYRSIWNKNSNTLHILPAWNREVLPNDNNINVVVYTNGNEVDLYFTPKGGVERKIGTKKFTIKETAGGYRYQLYEGQDKANETYKNLYLTWKMPFEEGTLRAVAKDENGSILNDTVGNNYITTTDRPSKIVLSAEKNQVKADSKDLIYVNIDIKDLNDNIVPYAVNDVKVTVSGAGKLIAMDNGSSPDHELYNSGHRKAIAGKLIAIIEPSDEGGNINIKAESNGLDSDTISINSIKDDIIPFVKSYKISKNYVLQLGNKPTLPNDIEVTYSDGKTKRLSVIWDIENINEKINTQGEYIIDGLITDIGLPISVNLSVVGRFAAVLNYSTGVKVGEKIELPNERPAVLQNGKITFKSYPVNWEEYDTSTIQAGDILEVNGEAEAFGIKYPVKATIRAIEQSIKDGDNSAQSAVLTDNIPNEYKSDTLDAIKDGSKEQREPNGDVNGSIWSNYKYSQTGNDKAEIKFTYATHDNVGKVKIYYRKDAWSAKLPKNVKFSYSQNEDIDSEYIEVNYVKTEPKKIAELGNGTETWLIEYQFDEPINLLYLKAEFTNSDEPTGKRSNNKDVKAVVGIVEMELLRQNKVYEVNSTASLSELNINSIVYGSEKLRINPLKIQDDDIDSIEAKTENNTAITILPAYDDVVKIVIESEDSKSRDIYSILLNSPIEFKADSPEMDVERAKIIDSKAGNYQPNEGPEKALDGNERTLWHTKWGMSTPASDKWLQVELDEIMEIDGIRYLPRTDGNINGMVKNFKVYVSNDGSEFNEVASGVWSSDRGWKGVEFEPIKAKYVRLQGVETYGEGSQADMFMSAAEFRVHKFEPQVKYIITDDGVGKVQIKRENDKFNIINKLSMTKLEESEYEDSLMLEDYIVEGYDIKLYGINDEIISDSGDIKLYVPAKQGEKLIKILHYGNEVEYKLKDEYITFKVNHLSKFYFLYEKPTEKDAVKPIEPSDGNVVEPTKPNNDNIGKHTEPNNDNIGKHTEPGDNNSNKPTVHKDDNNDKQTKQGADSRSVVENHRNSKELNKKNNIMPKSGVEFEIITLLVMVLSISCIIVIRKKNK